MFSFEALSFEVLSFLIHLFSSLSLFRSPFPLFPLLLPRSLTTTVSDDAPDAPSHPSLRRRSRRRRLVVVVVVERRRGAEVAGADTSDANAAPASSFLSPRPPVDVVSLRSESEERLCLFPCRRPGSFFARAADRGAREIEKERGGEKSPFSLFFLFAPTSPPPSPPQPAFFMKKMSVHATHIAIRSDSVRARAREKSRPLSFFLFAPTSPQNLLSSPLTLPSPTCLFIKKGERARDEMDERAGRARTRSVPTGCARKREGGGGTQRERGGGGRERASEPARDLQVFFSFPLGLRCALPSDFSSVSYFLLRVFFSPVLPLVRLSLSLSLSLSLLLGSARLSRSSLSSSPQRAHGEWGKIVLNVDLSLSMPRKCPSLFVRARSFLFVATTPARHREPRRRARSKGREKKERANRLAPESSPETNQSLSSSSSSPPLLTLSSSFLFFVLLLPSLLLPPLLQKQNNSRLPHDATRQRRRRGQAAAGGQGPSYGPSPSAGFSPG